MRWTVHGERPVYENSWVNVHLADVELPDGDRFEHHVVELRHVAVAALLNERRELLMMWRHRFITDTWAWELPMGLVEDGESPEQTAAREVEEETGWRPAGPMRPLVFGEPAAGITNSEHHVFAADSAVRVGEPTERNEAERIEWIPLDRLRDMVDRRAIVSGPTLIGVLYLLLDPPAPAGPRDLARASRA